jgi:hypothetical protein
MITWTWEIWSKVWVQKFLPCDVWWHKLAVVHIQTYIFLNKLFVFCNSLYTRSYGMSPMDWPPPHHPWAITFDPSRALLYNALHPHSDMLLAAVTSGINKRFGLSGGRTTGKTLRAVSPTTQGLLSAASVVCMRASASMLELERYLTSQTCA